MDPLLAVGRDTSGRNDTVEVRMSQQVLSPGMQDRKEANVCPEVARIAGHLEQGLGTGAEQEVIEDLLVLQRQWGELVRQSKDNMDIGDGQKFVLTSHGPFIASAALALWAMAIAATVIRDGAIATAWALVAMPTECRRTAASDGAKYFPVGPVDPAEVVLNEAIALGANDIGHLEEGPSHFFFNLRERWTPSRLETCRASSGLGMARRCLGERCR
jgi:hypothetical protein